MMITSETTTNVIQQRRRRFAPAAYGETVAKARADRVSDGIVLAAVGAHDAGTRDALTDKRTSRHEPLVVGSLRPVNGHSWRGLARLGRQ